MDLLSSDVLSTSERCPHHFQPLPSSRYCSGRHPGSVITSEMKNTLNACCVGCGEMHALLFSAFIGPGIPSVEHQERAIIAMQNPSTTPPTSPKNTRQQKTESLEAAEDIENMWVGGTLGNDLTSMRAKKTYDARLFPTKCKRAAAHPCNDRGVVSGLRIEDFPCTSLACLSAT